MTQKITLKEASELIESAATSLQNDIMSELKVFDTYERKIICYNGNTELSELKVGEDIVIVNGNLHVTGSISDCDGEDLTLLIVLGNVTCKNLLTYSTVFITGDLKVAHTLLADSGNDCTCKIGGNLEVRNIISGGHWITVQGEAKFQYYFNMHAEAEDKNGILKPNLGDADLMDSIEHDPDSYQGHSYVLLIMEVQHYGSFDTEKARAFIRNGGEWFCNQ